MKYSTYLRLRLRIKTPEVNEVNRVIFDNFQAMGNRLKILSPCTRISHRRGISKFLGKNKKPPQLLCVTRKKNRIDAKKASWVTWGPVLGDMVVVRVMFREPFTTEHKRFDDNTKIIFLITGGSTL